MLVLIPVLPAGLIPDGIVDGLLDGLVVLEPDLRVADQSGSEASRPGSNWSSTSGSSEGHHILKYNL